VITGVVTDGGAADDPTEPENTRRSGRHPAGYHQQRPHATGSRPAAGRDPAQYQSITGNSGTERLFRQMQYTIYYSDSEDSLPPFVWSVDLENEFGATTGTVKVVVFDRSRIARVAATYTKGDGTWTTVELTSSNGTEWSAQLPTDGAFFIQAADRAGNIAVADEKRKLLLFYQPWGIPSRGEPVIHYRRIESCSVTGK